MKRHILICDDNQDIRNLIETTLGRDLHEVAQASNGEEALMYLEENSAHLPDLVILDIAMPIMNGYQVLDAIKNEAKWNAIQVVILSAQTTQREKEALLAMGAYSILDKPFGPLDLLRLLDQLFDE